MAAGAITSELITLVRSRYGEPSEQGLFTSYILGFLNLAQNNLALMCNDAAVWALTEQATAALTLDEEPYALPANFLRERVVKYKTIVAHRLEVIRLDSIANNVYRLPTETEPRYFIWNGKLYLKAGTKTAGSYYLDYIKSPSQMSESVDPILGREFDEAMVTCALSFCREGRGHSEEAESLWQEYLGMIKVMNSRHSGAQPYDGPSGDRSE